MNPDPDLAGVRVFVFILLYNFDFGFLYVE